MATVTAREFNQDVSAAKRAAAEGPVIITDRGRPAKVILSFEEYERLSGKKKNLLELLAMPCDMEIDFDPPRLDGEIRIPEFD